MEVIAFYITSLLGYTQTTSRVGISAAPKHRNLAIVSCPILLILGDLRSSNCDSFRIAQIPTLEVVWVYQPLVISNLSFGFISLILRGFSLSSQSFYLEKGALVLPFGKNSENLRELPSDNKQNQPKTQVNITSLN